METLVFAFVILLVSMGGLALGAMAGRKPIKGSCGGLACVKGIDCGACRAKRTLEEPQ
ncbi:(Na+)-NQR maturation NqrM [Pararhizobium sp. IMCC21322]|uniref:(Na+)-NQR maturation NqrM n=1 Tax=Pararhizobium sp. IMCC21322 TaxID=3067903 RepID=UPI0027412B3C|nr:(Na+)-NQR maturation NqrM [Pararhizobium sp. IMCC21322]